MRRVILATSATGILTVAACVAAILQPATARAEAAAGDDTLEEVVITAQKRTERLQDVPVSASVLNSDSLANSNVSDVVDLNKLVPSLNLNGTINGRVPMGMRGISTVSNEQAVGVPSGVAIMIDGVPVPSDSFDGTQVEDVQNVEVLKGPQATLGGRTAAIGLINYRTYNPTDTLQGGLSLTGTTDHEYRATGHISGPITEGLDYSLSAFDAHRYYPITNTFYGTKTSQADQGLRAKLEWKPNDLFDAKLTFRHAKSEVDGFNFVYVHVVPGATLFFPGSPVTQAIAFPDITPSWQNLDYDSPVNTAGHSNFDNDAQLDLSFDVGNGYTLSSTTAYQHENQRQIQDLFATAVYGFDTFFSIAGIGPYAGGSGGLITSNPIVFDDTQHQRELITQKSEELKLVSPTDQAVSFVVGAFYSDTKVSMWYTRTLPPAALNVFVVPETKTTDLYGRATIKLATNTSLVTGLRLNDDELNYTYQQTIYNGEGPFYSASSSNSSAVVGDLSLQQKFTPDVMAYATYARGYSPEVYNTAATLTSNAALDPVPQEHINHFEIGVKGQYFDRALTANLSVFDTRYQNYQIQQYNLLPGQITSELVLSSAGGAETKGLEFDTSWRATPNTTVSVSGAYMDAKFTKYIGAPCAGYNEDPLLVTPGTYPAGCYLGSDGINVVQDLTGTTMPNAPKFKGYADFQQRIPLGAGGGLALLFDGNVSYRDKAQMLPDNNPNSIMGSVTIANFSLGLSGADGKWNVTAFLNNAFDKAYYTDVEDFWGSPWSNTATVIAQPARDAKRYGGIRVDLKL